MTRQFKAGDTVKINRGRFEGVYARVVGYSIAWEDSPVIEFQDDDGIDIVKIVPSERMISLVVREE